MLDAVVSHDMPMTERLHQRISHARTCAVRDAGSREKLECVVRTGKTGDDCQALISLTTMLIFHDFAVPVHHDELWNVLLEVVFDRIWKRSYMVLFK